MSTTCCELIHEFAYRSTDDFAHANFVQSSI